jgi:homoisocitrate dehydrogenase
MFGKTGIVKISNSHM